MYKHQTHSLPRIFSNYFIKNSQVHNYGTRNASGYSAHKRIKMFSDIGPFVQQGQPYGIL